MKNLFNHAGKAFSLVLLFGACTFAEHAKEEKVLDSISTIVELTNLGLERRRGSGGEFGSPNDVNDPSIDHRDYDRDYDRDRDFDRRRDYDRDYDRDRDFDRRRDYDRDYDRNRDYDRDYDRHRRDYDRDRDFDRRRDPYQPGYSCYDQEVTLFCKVGDQYQNVNAYTNCGSTGNLGTCHSVQTPGYRQKSMRVAFRCVNGRYEWALGNNGMCKLGFY